MVRRLLVLSFFVSLSGCAALTELFNAAFQKPTLHFVSAQPSNVALTGMQLDTVWEIENPNPVGLSLARTDYALFIDDHQVVAGHPPNGVTIPATGRGQLTFPAQIKFADIAPVLMTFLNKDRATYRVEGTVGIKTPIGVINFPLVAKGDFEVPKIPQVALQNPRVTNLTLQGATVEFPMTVTNRNSFQLPVSGITGTLFVGNASVGTVSTGDLGQVPPKGTRQVSLPVSINFLQGAGAAMNAIQGGTANVRFQAQMGSGGTSVPIDVSQALKFVR